MNGVLGEAVIGRQVHPAAEPPGVALRFRAACATNILTFMCTVGAYGIARMQYERHAQRLPRAARDRRS
jgi:hypothetical protein